MYDKDKTTIIDRREMLRVKLKSLAEETRIIRKEERRTYGSLRQELYLHRINEVRSAARSTHIAYGLIKGRTLEQMEHSSYSEPDWPAINKMIAKYGPKETQAATPINYGNRKEAA